MPQEKLTATISISTTTSSWVNVGDYERGGYTTPSALTGTTMTWEVSNDDSQGTVDPVRNEAGTALGAVTVAVDKVYTIPAEVFSHRFARLKSGSTEVAARDIVVFLTGPKQ